MIVRTLFQRGAHPDHGFDLGEVEVKLLPGIPVLHVVGLPDASMRECGLRLKSALRSCGLRWPKGHQIVVNLRPTYVRKSSAGVDLAIALAFLALTGQLPGELKEALRSAVAYGEITLSGEVYAPDDLGRALRAVRAARERLSGEASGGAEKVDARQDRDDTFALTLVTGKTPQPGRRAGTHAHDSMTSMPGRWTWHEIHSLLEPQMIARASVQDRVRRWREPEVPDLELPESAANLMALAVHTGAHVLLAGPQGSGKSTWAKSLYALTPEPEANAVMELADLFGEQVVSSLQWRPCEQPHHTATPQALIGGGLPPRPGVLSRAHGGVLIMDEFLQFPSAVLEALREPLESGVVEVARSGVRAKLPARFQLIATTNLCPCGKMYPGNPRPGCGRNLTTCRSVCQRLSGPLMDRFDLLAFSHAWLSSARRNERRVHMMEIKGWVRAMAEFANGRAEKGGKAGPRGGFDSAALRAAAPGYVNDLELSHRRRRAMLRLARALADREQSERVSDRHFLQALDMVNSPMDSLRQVFA